MQPKTCHGQKSGISIYRPCNIDNMVRNMPDSKPSWIWQDTRHDLFSLHIPWHMDLMAISSCGQMPACKAENRFEEGCVSCRKLLWGREATEFAEGNSKGCITSPSNSPSLANIASRLKKDENDPFRKFVSNILDIADCSNVSADNKPDIPFNSPKEFRDPAALDKEYMEVGPGMRRGLNIMRLGLHGPIFDAFNPHRTNSQLRRINKNQTKIRWEEHIVAV